MILLTGGTSEIGTAAARVLAQSGAKVRALVRNPAKAQPLRDLGFEIAQGDFADAASVSRALTGCTSAFLTSSPAPDTVPIQSAFIDLAAKQGIKHLVKLSAVGSKPGVCYRFGDWHGQVEHHLRLSGMSWTMVRPNFFFQNLLTMAGSIKAGALYVPAGDGKAPFVDVEDIGAVVAHCLMDPVRHAHRSYEVSGPAAIGYADIAAAFSAALGKAVIYQDVPIAMARQAMIAAGMPDWAADAINELNTELKLGHFSAVSTDVKTVTGRDPKSLQQFIAANLQVFS